MLYRMMEQIQEKIPEVVSKLLLHDKGFSHRQILETVTVHAPNGSRLSLNYYLITKEELIRHVQAAAEKGFEITSGEGVVTIKRALDDGDYAVAKYRPRPE